jgi:hypothetical protein
VYGSGNIELEEIGALDVIVADERSAAQLVDFLLRYLGREGARPLGADTLARDLGFESEFCDRHVTPIRELVGNVFESNPKYAGLIEKLWRDFVAYLGDNGAASDSTATFTSGNCTCSRWRSCFARTSSKNVRLRVRTTRYVRS